jgi:hypothetical protein
MRACHARRGRKNAAKEIIMDHKAIMKKIVERIGREKAIELVTQAYNTEMLTTLLNRLEENKPNMISKFNRRDQLGDALQRVLDVCDLTV